MRAFCAIGSVILGSALHQTVQKNRVSLKMSTNMRLFPALAILLATSMACLASEEAWIDAGNVTDCQPDIPPLMNSSDAMVTLQMHQWVWIENLTSPDWAPRTDSGGPFYEFLKAGFVRQQRLVLRSLLPRVVYTNVSFVTNGETLCAATLTEHRNRTSGELNRVSCSRMCHSNFTNLGLRANLPLVVYDDWVKLTRFNEYLAFDAVDPESRASYNCMGRLWSEPIASLPSLMTRQMLCREGDECLFNYDNTRGLNTVFAGCKSDFSQYNWCVSDVDLCSINIDGDCPVCCRGDLCNKAVAQKAYKRWLEKGASGGGAASVWLLTLGFAVVSFQWLRSDP